MKLDTYLFFNGQCRAAFEHYRSIFGGKFDTVMTYADGPPEMCEDGDADRIMHMSLPIGESVLMGSDAQSSRPTQEGQNFAITASVDSRSEADRVFEKLSAGGETQFPMQKTFWGSYFGACQDRFGINWQVSAPLEQD